MSPSPRDALGRTRLLLNRRALGAMRSRVASEPPWRADFLDHVGAMDSPAFVLSTLGRAAAAGPDVVAPRARTVVFRGMWASLPVNPKNPAELNAHRFTTSLPTATTDARMDKASELAADADADAAVAPGRLVEGVFWAAEAKTQWRLRGRAYLLGPDADSDAAAPVRAALEPYMRPSDAASDAAAAAPWSWSREVTAHFGNLSPLMRGTFRNPPPGTPRSRLPASGEGLGLGQSVDDVDDEVARRNFRVVVIVPDEVDRVDLSDPQQGQRWNYRFEGEPGEGEWKVTETWP